MKPFRLLVIAVLAVACFSASALAQGKPLPARLVHALVRAQSVHIVSGHVKYYSYKHRLFKAKLVDSTPFEKPCRKALKKWGRFKIVPNAANADLVIGVYMTGSTQSVPVSSPYVTGSVDVGNTYIVMDVVQRASGKILWQGRKTSPVAGAPIRL